MSTYARAGASARRRAYLLAGAIAVAGLAGAGLWAGSALLAEADRPAGFERVTAPGEGTVTLAAGDLVVYAEGPARPPAADHVTITGPDGAAVPLRSYAGDLRYHVPGTRGPAVGTAVGTFTATDAGTYRLGTADFAGTLAVGRDLAPGTLRAVVLPALLGLASLTAGVALAVRTATRTATPTRTATRRTPGA